jgi:hypothetical protein
LDEAKKRLSSPMNDYEGKPPSVFVVAYSKTPGSKGDAVECKILGTYSNFESANVRAMEFFQKEHSTYLDEGRFDEVYEGSDVGYDECGLAWSVGADGCLSLRECDWKWGDGHAFVLKRDLED